MIGVTEGQIKQMVQDEIMRQIAIIRHDWEQAFERKDEPWEVGTRYYYTAQGTATSSQLILRKKTQLQYPGTVTAYQEQVANISLPALLLALMEYCGLEFQITPAIKKAAEVKIVRAAEQPK